MIKTLLGVLLLLSSLTAQCLPWGQHPPGVSTVPNTTLGCDEISSNPQAVWLSMEAPPSERGGPFVFTITNVPQTLTATLIYGLALTTLPAAVPGIQFPGTTNQFCTWHIYPELTFFGVIIPSVPCYRLHLLTMPPIPGLRGFFLRAQMYGEDWGAVGRPRFVTNSLLMVATL